MMQNSEHAADVQPVDGRQYINAQISGRSSEGAPNTPHQGSDQGSDHMPSYVPPHVDAYADYEQMALHHFAISQIETSISNQTVKRDLESYHTFFIVLSGTIGMGLFNNSGEIFGITGPGGGILAFTVIVMAVIFVMIGIAKKIGHWPIANGMIEFIRVFVDKDLAIVIGFAYWFAYSISFATLIIAGAKLASYLTWSLTGQDIVFIFKVAVPLGLLGVNCLGVKWYGWIEVGAGILKILLVIGAFLIMCVINAREQFGYINDGVQNDLAVPATPGIAVLVSIAIAIATYFYIGVEIAAVTALEAHNPTKSLKWPAKFISYLTASIYIFSLIFSYLDTGWQDASLPQFVHILPTSDITTTSTAIVVMVVPNANISVLPDILNVFLIVAVLIAANTALYVSSRTLYGLTRDVNLNSPHWWERGKSKLSTTIPKRNIPGWALFASAGIFCWVVFLRLSTGVSDQNSEEIMSRIATVAMLLVWASQCLAFIRYRLWLRRYNDFPYRRSYNRYDGNTAIHFSSMLDWAQPLLAYFGLIGCCIIVLVFPTAEWWNQGETTIDIWAAYVGPVALLIFWLILKVFHYHKHGLYVKLVSNVNSQVPPLYPTFITTIVSKWWIKIIENQHLLFLPVKFDQLLRWEPRLPDGMTRVRWKCSCGKSMYDDFTELRPGAAVRLENLLNRRNDSNATMRTRISLKVFNTLSITLQWIKKMFRNEGLKLPQHELQNGSSERPDNSSAQPAQQLFLLLCHTDGIYATRLLQINICDLKSDEKLFTALKESYKDLRGKWWSLLSFRTLTKIGFVEFELHKNRIVDIRKKPAIPPENLVGHEYDYKPVPPELIPPVGESLLMHFFHNPHEAEDETFCLERFPKKLRERLAVYTNRHTCLGWGLHFEEGWDSKKTWIVACVTFLLASLLWGILWAVFERSIQDAFTISSYIVTWTVLLIGLAQAIVGDLK